MNSIEFLSKQDRSIFNALAEIARDLKPVARARVVAALAYKNIIVIGSNTYKTDPFHVKYSNNKAAICLHAETQTIKNGSKLLTTKELRYSKLYILRLKYPSGTKTKLGYGLALPCEACQRAITEHGIRKVFYTTDNGIDRLITE